MLRLLAAKRKLVDKARSVTDLVESYWPWPGQALGVLTSRLAAAAERNCAPFSQKKILGFKPEKGLKVAE